jgi:hypothetical protein
MHRQTRRVLIAGVTAALLGSCTPVDPKTECVRWKVERNRLWKNWGVYAPQGLDLLGRAKWEYEFIQRPDKAEQVRKVDEPYERVLRTKNVAAFCSELGVYVVQ